MTTVKQAKTIIAAALEDLQKQGVTVREISITWSSDVVPEDKEKLDVEIRCKVGFEADL